MKKAKTVSEYIANAPEEMRGRLKEIRASIKSAAPKAEEKISYAMPYYGYKGRLVYFAYFKNHIGVYLTPPITAIFKKELKDYETHMATIRFPHNKKLPLALIKKLVRARVKLNEEKEK
ncbi:MAG TPA: DUF1801 domain-containing protein [Patescibacteria group bacterium]|nr:DUF1801 domain-containing protein [Patescibacteria group bacterium]